MGDKNNIESIMSNLIQLLQEAGRKEDIHGIKMLLSEIMKLADDPGTCEHGNHNVSEEIRQLGLELAMNILSESGDAEMVQFLGKLNSKFPASQVLVDGTQIDNQEHLQRQTALLQVCNANSEIELIIPWTSAHQETASPVQQSPELPARTTNDRNLVQWSIETRNVLIMVVGMISTLFFTVTINLPASFFKEDYLADKSLSAKDVIAGDLPAVVYLMIFNSTGFMATMAVIIVLVWPLQFRTILLLLMMCACIVYIILVSKMVPKFSLRVGKFSVSSIVFVWSIVLALIFSGISILSLRKCTSTLCQFIRSIGCGRKEFI